MHLWDTLIDDRTFLLLFFSCLQYWANTGAIPTELDWNPQVMIPEALGCVLNE